MGTALISPTCSDSVLRATRNGTSTLMMRSLTQRTKTSLKNRFKFMAQNHMRVNSTMTTLTHCLRHMSLPSNGSSSTIQKGPFVIYRQTLRTMVQSRASISQTPGTRAHMWLPTAGPIQP